MKCPSNCRCGKHFRHDPRQNNRVRNPQLSQHERMALAQRERQHLASKDFDWDYAIELNRKTRREIYGDDNEIS